MALTHDLQVCDWKSKDAWARGIADLLIIDDENMTAWVVDYKTGNDKYPDRDQLRLMSLMVFKHFPHIRKVNSALLFVVKNSMVKHSMTVDEADAEWWRYRERVAKIEASVSNDVWNPTRTRSAVGAHALAASSTPRGKSWTLEKNQLKFKPFTGTAQTAPKTRSGR